MSRYVRLYALLKEKGISFDSITYKEVLEFEQSGEIRSDFR